MIPFCVFEGDYLKIRSILKVYRDEFTGTNGSKKEDNLMQYQLMFKDRFTNKILFNEMLLIASFDAKIERL